MCEEIFRDTQFENYQVSNLGNVKSFKLHREGVILNPRADSSGYLRVDIWKNEKRTARPAIHRLVARVFLDDYDEKLDCDHINGVRTDNRVENLRMCTRTQNMYNSKKQSNNTSGFKGVCWHKKNQKWRVRIRINGKRKHIGYFDDYDEACQISTSLRKNLHKDFYCERE